ncbi:MAG: hypothetical protein ACK5MH_09895 [Bacteroidales bacterium]
MNRQNLLSNLISKILNPVFVFNYIFVFALFVSYSMSGFNKSILFLNFKLILIFFVITYILPLFTMYSIRNTNLMINNLKKDFSNTYYIVNLIYFSIAWFYFSLLKLPFWLEVIFSIPVVSMFFIFIANRYIKVTYQSLALGSLTFYIYYLTIILQGFIGILPFIISVSISGISLSNEIKSEISSFKLTGISYIIGIISSVFAILFYMVFQS